MDEFDEQTPPTPEQIEAYRKQANKYALASFGKFCMAVGKKS